MTRPRAFEPAVEQARAALWARFVTPQHVILDYVGENGEVLLPTPEECLANQPNALSWGCPNENGPMFGGAYLEALVDRWRLTGAAEDATRARQVVAVGLPSAMQVPRTSATAG